MAYTWLQQLRKGRATNKGLNRKMAASFRKTAHMLETKGPEEFSRLQIQSLQLIREMITHRLYANACTKGLQDIINGKYKIKNGKYTYTMDEKIL
jgi:hypothetical protein